MLVATGGLENNTSPMRNSATVEIISNLGEFNIFIFRARKRSLELRNG